ncbi:hypothetical protein SAMD00023353_10600200 [Rosellinia necatrix]|uniref:Uncharacterized protein n=1 Tax=Rosellinia necatrix TaxID=77044 RepID=A0A1S7UMA9_ROSNE|nr:hypothetical protein SAMD00023353_10600200 [Rosellinia necatrix]
MYVRTSYASVLALWLFVVDSVSSQIITRISPTQTDLAPESTSAQVSPSLNRNREGRLGETAKVGISVGVTLASIILVGSIAILCVIRRRHKALARPQTRGFASSDIEDENVVAGDDPGKGKDVYYMSPATVPPHGVPQQAPEGFVYQGGTYPDQTYALQQQPQTMGYPAVHPGETYAYSGTAYPGAAYPGTGTMAIDPSQQNGFAGPSNTQYQYETYHQQQQQQQQQYQQEGYPQSQRQSQQQQQGGHISWIYPASTTSPVDAAPIQDFQYVYLQDYQQQQQQQAQGSSPDPNQTQSQNGDHTTTRGYRDDDGDGGGPYHVPPPHPHASELPDQRRPVELMGEGHYKEAP